MRWILISIALLLSNPLFADPTNNKTMNHAEKLHNAKCTHCHKSEMYTRKNRQINSLGALKNQVRRCEAPANTNWKPQETDAVIEFLNKEYYKF